MVITTYLGANNYHSQFETFNKVIWNYNKFDALE